MEEFDAMPRKTQLFYIASENEESVNPCRRDVFVKKKGGSK